MKYKNLKPSLNKSNNSKTVKSINTNNYIINTLNLSEKKNNKFKFRKTK